MLFDYQFGCPSASQTVSDILGPQDVKSGQFEMYMPKGNATKKQNKLGLVDNGGMIFDILTKHIL